MTKKTRGYRARILTALGFGFFVDSAEDLALPMLAPAIQTSLNLTYSNLGVIYAIRTIFQTLSGPFWGMAADRWNRKWILVIGTGLWGVWTLVCGLVTDYHQLLAVRAIACLGLGCLYPAAFSMLADVFGPHQRGRAMGIIGAIGMFGIVAAALGFGPLLGLADKQGLPGMGWRLAFVILGLASVISGIVIALLVRDPVRGGAEPELEEIITEKAAEEFRFHIADVKEVLRSHTVLVNLVQGSFLMTTINAMSIYLVTWLVNDREFSNADADMIFGGMVLALAVGSIVGGLVADWADTRWPGQGRIAVSQISIALTFPTMWYLLTAAESLEAILACGIFTGFFLEWTRRGVKQPLVQAVIRPELRSTAMALTEFFQGAVASVVVILLGKFADSFQSLGLTRALLVACGCWAVAYLVATAYYYTYPRESESLRHDMLKRREIILGKGEK